MLVLFKKGRALVHAFYFGPSGVGSSWKSKVAQCVVARCEVLPVQHLSITPDAASRPGEEGCYTSHPQQASLQPTNNAIGILDNHFHWRRPASG